MILLIGGTGESAFLAESLISAGFQVLISTATDMPLELREHPSLSRRSGELDRESLCRLVNESGIRAIIDASHPYASIIKTFAKRAADELGIPYLRWSRPPVLSDSADIVWADSHEAAATTAFSYGQPVLLTTGSRNLEPYAVQSRHTGTKLVARVLDHPDSMEACRKAGIPEGNVVAGKGPFSLEENVQAIREFGIGVLVTKDSGAIGGVPEKIEAARLQNCRVVVVRRPEAESEGAFDNVDELIIAVHRAVAKNSVRLSTLV
ncbi:MAG: precorrin-6A reductase [Desulfomonile tiedjei]|uniref:Precorrin-6A reductase n=1 Tax=Desulfomonile tiedjei TaxID=2358 RepID=A0A9D6V2V7_9BACT|nr:precorrin-6A reductase [Desulfomonile tiedjei]